MTQELTIVMYHYIRDFEQTRFPRIKGLELAGFERQLDHLSDGFEIVTMEDLISAAAGDHELPGKAALLTFDDGYAEHYDLVFPMLHDRGLQGSFFPPVAPVVDGTLLDVNRVHFILASVESPTEVAAAIDDAVAAAAGADGIDSVTNYRAEWAHANRFDGADTIYAKRMLQTALPSPFRAELASRLFARFVTADEAGFASELYINREQAREMIDGGMYVGSHGRSHVWLNHADQATRVAEIEGSVSFLRDLGMPVDDHWVMCYPFGGWDEELVDLLKERGCSIGLTTTVGTARIGTDHRLALPRYDTNDFPQ